MDRSKQGKTGMELWMRWGRATLAGLLGWLPVLCAELLTCPDCKYDKVSSYSDKCIRCGCPISVIKAGDGKPAPDAAAVSAPANAAAVTGATPASATVAPAGMVPPRPGMAGNPALWRRFPSAPAAASSQTTATPPVPVVPSVPTVPPGLLDRVKQGLILISTHSPIGAGLASGCFVEMGGEMFIVTNQHVIFGMTEPAFKTFDGVELRMTGMEVAKDVDLVRIRFAPVKKDAVAAPVGIPLNPQPEIGASVTSFGNSGGGNVITQEPGKVLGISGDQIEISNNVVRGNSGGPLVDDSGRLVCIVTHGMEAKVEDWTNAGTRYAQTRRFGARISDRTQWMNPQAFEQQSALLWDLNQSAIDIHTMLTTKDFPGFVNNYDGKKEAKRFFSPDYSNQFNSICLRCRYTLDEANRGRTNVNRVREDMSVRRDMLRRMIESAEKKLAATNWNTEFLKSQADLLAHNYGVLKNALGR